MMKKLMILCLVMALPQVLLAANPSNFQPRPAKAPVAVFHPSSTQPQPGDDIPLAIPVPGLPFNDTGNTCNFLDDYSGSCFGSGSPDVVYAFTPAVDMVIDVDLRGSDYDTGLLILDAAENELACNDDFGSDLQSAILGFPVAAGATYYIVVDGFGGECGNYLLNITEAAPPCVVQCPADAVDEGEPTLVDGYVDALNGGCNSDPFVIQTINWINADDTDGAAWLCGTSGWYLNDTGSPYRDTDWFEVTALASGNFVFEVTGEYPMRMFVMLPFCDTVDWTNIIYQADAGPCQVGNITFPVQAGETYWLWVGPQEFSGPVREFKYFMRAAGNSYDVVPTEATSWGAVKATFR